MDSVEQCGQLSEIQCRYQINNRYDLDALSALRLRAHFFGVCQGLAVKNRGQVPIGFSGEENVCRERKMFPLTEKAEWVQ